MKRIGCFHAHYSNIEHVEKALSDYEVELIHFVDPGLDRIKKDTEFTMDIAKKKVADTINWIAKSHVDAILVTCTFFTAIFHEKQYPIPVIKIDDPLFHNACSSDKPIIFVFTNPNTIEGTIKQFIQFSKNKGIEKKIETRLVPNSFELIMQGKKDEYLKAVSNELVKIIEENPSKLIIASQLSMAPAAQYVETIKETYIGNQLVSLASYMEETLSLQVKQNPR